MFQLPQSIKPKLFFCKIWNNFLKTSQSANSAWLHVVSIHSARSTCSGNFSPSKTRNKTLNKSSHHRCSHDWPWDFINSNKTVNARVRTSSLQRLILNFIFRPYCLLFYLITADNSNMRGNHPRSQTLSSIGIKATSSPLIYYQEYFPYYVLIFPNVIIFLSVLKAFWLFSIWSATIRMSRIASIEVSGNCELHPNSDKHFTQSCR